MMFLRFIIVLLMMMFNVMVKLFSVIVDDVIVDFENIVCRFCESLEEDCFVVIEVVVVEVWVFVVYVIYVFVFIVVLILFLIGI